jgi:hypothetical protein
VEFRTSRGCAATGSHIPTQMINADPSDGLHACLDRSRLRYYTS